MSLTFRSRRATGASARVWSMERSGSRITRREFLSTGTVTMLPRYAKQSGTARAPQIYRSAQDATDNLNFTPEKFKTPCFRRKLA